MNVLFRSSDHLKLRRRLRPRRSWLGAGLAGLLLLSGLTLSQAATRIRLATLAPTGSVYHKHLLVLRDEWRELSGGQVNLMVYADGKLGGEAKVIRLMGLKSVQAAMVTAVGLSEIEPAVDGLQNIPMGFRDYAEVDYVGSKLQPMLEERLASKGFVVLGWSDAGWVRFFTTQRVVTPDDLKQLKLFSWSGSPETVSVYRSAGFTAVALETADIVPGLETGLIEAVACPPIFALKSQIDRRAPHMLKINWGPLVGAIIIRKETWESLPPAIRTPMLEASRNTAAQIKASGRSESLESAQAMTGRGLTITSLTPEQTEEWRSLAETVYPEIREKVMAPEVFDRTMEILREYRASKP